MDLLRLTKEKRSEIAQWLFQEIDIAIQSRSELDKDLEIFYELYEMKLPPIKDWPWPEASRTFIPVIPDKVDSLVSRIVYSSVKSDPLFIFNAVSPESERYSPILESYYSYKAKKLNYRKMLRKGIQLAVRDGTSFIEVNRRHDIEWTVQPTLDAEGNTRLKKLPTTVFDDCVLASRRLKDIYLIPAGIEDIEQIYGIARRFWLRPTEVKEEVQLKRFYSDAVSPLSPDATDRGSYFGSGQEDTVMGQISIIAPVDTEEIPAWECFAVVIKYDIDDDGHLELCRFLVQKRDKILLRAEEYPYTHRLLNFIPLSPFPRSSSPYGISLVGRLENIQREINSDRNQRRDSLTLALSPPMKRLSTSPTKLESKPWGPAQIYDVHDLKDMSPMEINDIPASAFMEEAGLLQFADRLSSSPSFPMGKEATAREVSATQGDATLKFDLIMQEILEAISQVGYQLFWLDKQYVSEGGYTYYQEINGKFVEKTVPPEAFDYDYEIRINGNFVTFDKERRRQDLLFLYDLLLKNPLLVGTENGAVPPNFGRIYHLTRYLLMEWGIQDIESMIGKEEEYIAPQQSQLGGLAGPGVPGGMAPSNGGLQGLQMLLGNPALLSTFGG